MKLRKTSLESLKKKLACMKQDGKNNARMKYIKFQIKKRVTDSLSN